MAYLTDFSQALKQLQSAAAQSTFSTQELAEAMSHLVATGAVPLEQAMPEIEAAVKRAQYTTLQRNYKTLQSRH